MAEQLLMHVGLSQEGYHEDLFLFQAQPRAAVDIPIQMAPAYPVKRDLMPCLVAGCISCGPIKQH